MKAGYGRLVQAMVIFLVAGCAASGMKNVQHSGFLGDYSQLAPGAENQAAQIYVNKTTDFKSYDKVMFDRVVVMLNDKAEYKAIDPASMAMLTDHYQTALMKAVEGDLQIVDKPGPGVMRIRAAITDIKPSKPMANTLSTIVPVGIVVAGATKAVSDENLGTGEAGSEVEIIDSVSGVRLAAAVDKRQGGKGVFRGEWEDTTDAFDYWASLLKKRLADLRN